MMKILNKLLLLSATCLLSSNLFAQDTVCFKNNIEKPSNAEAIALDGGACEGKFSLNEMKENGWDVLDIKILPSKNKFNYTYYLIKNNNQNGLKNPAIEDTTISKKNFSIKPVGMKIENIKDNKTTINL